MAAHDLKERKTALIEARTKVPDLTLTACKTTVRPQILVDMVPLLGAKHQVDVSGGYGKARQQEILVS